MRGLPSSFTGSESANGTSDQGGNVYEWHEAIISGSFRGVRGGPFDSLQSSFAALDRVAFGAASADFGVGIRVAGLPEPSTVLLVMAGVLGLVGWRGLRA